MSATTAVEMPEIGATGLTPKEVVQRIESGQSNAVKTSTSRSVQDIVRANVFTLFNGIIFAAMVLVLITGSWRDAVFGFVIIINTGIGIVTELRAKRTLDRLSILVASEFLVHRDGRDVEVPHNEIVLDDLLWIRAGEQVPADGQIIQTWGLELDESMLTGEALPVAKREGDEVTGGTLNTTGALEVKAVRVGADSTLARIVRAVEDAQGSKAPVQRLADKIAAVFVPAILIIAAITFCVWFFFVPPNSPDALLQQALLPAIAVIVVACPCALGLATPTALMVGMGKGAQLGILIKDGEVLERVCKLRNAIMDKTGTITRGAPEVIACDVPADALRLSAALETKSEHPLARAVVLYAARSGALGEDVAVQEPGSEGFAVALSAALPEPESFEAVIGSGVTGIVEGHEVFVGSRVVVDGVDVGGFDFADAPKPDARETIETLANEYHVDSYMVTGDGEGPALAVAEAVGIPAARVLYGVRPFEKAQCVRDVKEAGGEDGVTAFVGDGINDAPALAAADVGIAMASGTDVALDAGSVVLMHNRLSDLVVALRLSKATMRKIRQNLFWALIYNCIMIPLAAVGILAPALAGAAMALSSVSVVCNSLLLKRFR